MKGLIFDLDGTLVDTLDDLAAAVNMTREFYGMAPLPRERIIPEIGTGGEYLVRQTVPATQAPFEEIFARYLAFYNEHLLDHSRLHAGVGEVLERFRGRTLGVVTNKAIHESERILVGLQVREYFQCVLGGDSLPRKKPDPLPIHHFMTQHSLAPAEVVMIGDGYHDIRAGKAAGVMTVAVTTGVSPREALESERPDHIIDRMDQLLELVD
jgi:phosphoglycolate phosphatase